MMFYGSGVGTPVTRSPRHRPGRAVFSHPVPRLYSLSRERGSHANTSSRCVLRGVMTRGRATPSRLQARLNASHV
jgi:hypothetical protein